MIMRKFWVTIVKLVKNGLNAMELELNGKVALVTGSSRGIGRAIAETLYTEECKVVINGRSREDLRRGRARS
jgi:NADP-dependent 3-hydroxy acid dehydrogenase YdfG